MTMGPAIVAMAWLERVEFSAANPVVVFGRVPFFFFVAHLAVIHAVTVALNFLRYGAAPFLLEAGPSMGGPRSAFPPDYGFSLWVVYAVWVAVVVALYPACLWFARVRERRYQTRHALTRTIGASALHENAS
jgi:hypothetical protein